MKFAVGYQQPESGEPFSAIVKDYKDSIEEVYFAWVGAPSGRAPLGGYGHDRDWRVQAELEHNLAEIHALGIKLDLLFNANCYGGAAMSEALADEVSGIIAQLSERCGAPEIVTTTSPTIAHVVKTRFPKIEIRASVNMRIGTTQAMDYASTRFDSFYLQRDLQRNTEYVGKVHDWCVTHDKKLCLLANSGCLRFCPGQTHHDNAVAHEEDIRQHRNLDNFNPLVCWNLYRDRARRVEFLKSTWIRPEDLNRYDGLVDVCKLATRQHSHPRMVLDAYTRRRYNGDLLNLMEPCFAPVFAPSYIDNAAFPADWAERTAQCDGNCGDCVYCDEVMESVLKDYDEGFV